MSLVQALLLGGCGLAGGIVAGLLGVGGGIVFAPVLFFTYRSLGADPALIAPLTLGSSLLCTLTAATSSTVGHHRAGAVRWRTGLTAGTASAVTVFLMVRFVTTRPWYDGTVFQGVFGALLLVVAVRMIAGGGSGTGADANTDASGEIGAGAETVAGTETDPHAEARSTNPDTDRPMRADGPPLEAGLAAVGTAGLVGAAAGVIAPAAGIGGGVLLVPAFHRLLGLPIREAVATSSAAIVLISLSGVLNYGLMGGDVAALTSSSGFAVPWRFGYVDLGRGLLLAVPALVGARGGAALTHWLPERAVRWTFGLLALGVGARLIFGVL